jgi:hypothetical protein
MKHKNKTQYRMITYLLLAVMLVLGTGMSVLGPVAPAADDFTLSVDNSSKSGPPGTPVTYTFSVAADVDADTTFNIFCEGGTVDCPASVVVGVSDLATFSLEVLIPAGASSGEQISTLVTVVDTQSDIAKSVSLTTIAYLPPSATETPTPYKRPLIGLKSYSTGVDEIVPGSDFTLTLNLHNSGPTLAGTVVVSFESMDFLPLETGGVQNIAELGAGKTVTISQPMRANFSMWGYDSGTIVASVTYSDVNGLTYSETFTLTIDLKTPVYVAATPTPTPTSTPDPSLSAQLVVNTYSTDTEPLQPGNIFNLTLDITNIGLDTARKVTMVLGGGVESVQPGDNTGSSTAGMSGGGADLTHFAPLGSSNLIFLNDVIGGATQEVSVQLIVNVTTTPGAYPFKISFVYEDAENHRVVDDQVITLLVYRLPKVDLSFYRTPDIFYVGQPGMLPLQITNVGSSTAVLGNMVVTTDAGEITENTLLVGALEPGGYYTMDATAWPIVEGPMNIFITIQYTDDFNQSRVIEQTLVLTVESMPVYEDPYGEDPMGPMMPDMDNIQPETIWQKLLRFLLGLLGLDSGKITEPELMQPVEQEEYMQPIVVPGGGKGG